MPNFLDQGEPQDGLGAKQNFKSYSFKLLPILRRSEHLRVQGCVMSSEDALTFKGICIQGFTNGSIRFSTDGFIWVAQDKSATALRVLTECVCSNMSSSELTSEHLVPACMCLEWCYCSTKKLQWSKVDYVTWAIFGKYAHLRFFMQNKAETPMRLDGFKKEASSVFLQHEIAYAVLFTMHTQWPLHCMALMMAFALLTDYSSLQTAFSGWSIEFKKEKVNCGGGNYGEFNMKDGRLQFGYGNKSTFDVNMKQISQCVLPGNKKGNDVELQFHENDTADKSEDCLVEMRLYLPEDVNDDESGNDDQPAPMYTSETFQQAVMDQANI
eukprot:18501-Heterococcus_DN1.PRE.2